MVQRRKAGRLSRQDKSIVVSISGGGMWLLSRLVLPTHSGRLVLARTRRADSVHVAICADVHQQIRTIQYISLKLDEMTLAPSTAIGSGQWPRPLCPTDTKITSLLFHNHVVFAVPARPRSARSTKGSDLVSMYIERRGISIGVVLGDTPWRPLPLLT